MRYSVPPDSARHRAQSATEESERPVNEGKQGVEKPETEKEAPEDTEPRVDVRFAVQGESLPLDHGYALFGALGGVLGDLHGAPWLAVHPVRGQARGDGTLGLGARGSSLVLRVALSRVPQVLVLAGKDLVVAGRSLALGTSTVLPLRPARTLAARQVVIKGFLEPEPFRAAVQRQLAARSVEARVELGRRRVLQIAGDKVVGFAVTLHELSPQHSLVVQSHGVGGRQRFGCGVFTPQGREG